MCYRIVKREQLSENKRDRGCIHKSSMQNYRHDQALQLKQGETMSAPYNPSLISTRRCDFPCVS